MQELGCESLLPFSQLCFLLSYSIVNQWLGMDAGNRFHWQVRPLPVQYSYNFFPFFPTFK